MIRRAMTLTNKLGLHARAAAKFVHAASQFDASITVEMNGQSVEGKSILGLLLLAAPVGSELTVTCDGDDEAAAISALEALVDDRFGEGE